MSQPTDPIKAIRLRYAGTLPGPWRAHVVPRTDDSPGSVSVVSDMAGGDPVQVTAEMELCDDPWQSSQMVADHRFIAAAPMDIKFLINQIDGYDGLREQLSEMKVLRNHWFSEAVREYQRAEAAETELSQLKASDRGGR